MNRRKKKSVMSALVILILILIIVVGGFVAYKNYQNKKTLESFYYMGIDENKQIGRAKYDIEYDASFSHSIGYPTIGQKQIDSKILSEVERLKDEFKSMYNGDADYQYIDYETFIGTKDTMGLVFLENLSAGNSNVISEKAITYNFDLITGKQLELSDIFKNGYKEKLSKCVRKYFESKQEYKDLVTDEGISNTENNLNKVILTADKILVFFDKYEAFPGYLGIVKAEVSYGDMEDYMKINPSKQTEIPENNVGVENEVKAVYKEVNEKVYAKTNVKVRKEDNTSSEKIATLAAGTEITRVGIGDNGWSKVIYNKQTAYVNSSYLSKEKTKEPEHTKVEITVNGNRKIDPSKPMVALTFDDGPNAKATPKILDTLEKYNVVATFFDLGSSMQSYPKISQRAEAIGCEVETHTYAHKNLNILSQKQISEDLAKAKKTYEKVLGHSPKLVRPPYGNANSTVKATVKYPLINWDIDTLDWKSRNADSILKEIHKYSNYNGRIILMHSIYTSTADAVERFVPELIKKGYQLVTVSEMAYYKGKTLQTGEMYYNFR